MSGKFEIEFTVKESCRKGLSGIWSRNMSELRDNFGNRVLRITLTNVNGHKRFGP